MMAYLQVHKVHQQSVAISIEGILQHEVQSREAMTRLIEDKQEFTSFGVLT